MNSNRQLISTIEKIVKELSQRITGHAEAYVSLLSSTDSKNLEKLYLSKASDIWLKIFGKNSKDWIAAHHLAISTHAEAFDLELEGDTEAAYPIWQKANNYWHKLYVLEEPLKTVQELMQNMDRYQAEIQDKRYENLNRNFAIELLSVHQNFYYYYLEKEQIENADRHYELIEASNFKEAGEVLLQMYETKFGNKVDQLGRKVDAANTQEKIETLTGDILSMKKTIVEISTKRSSLTVAIRDLLKLSSWTIALGLEKWRKVDLINFNEEAGLLYEEKGILAKELDRIREQLERLDRTIKNIQYNIDDDPGLAYQFRDEYENLIDKRNALVPVHNNKLDEIREKGSQIENRKQDLSGAIEALKYGFLECENYLSKLNIVQDKRSLESSVAVLKSTTDKVLFLKEIKGITDLEGYELLQEHATRMNKRLANISSFEDWTNEPEDVDLEREGIWSLEEIKKKENPYRNTCFLMLETEFPALNQDVNITDLVRKLKLSKKKLERKASAGKHIVLDKTIKEEDLNRISSKLDDPLYLTKNILLQHQAHQVSLEDIKKSLSDISSTKLEKVPLKLAPGIFSLFDWSIPEFIKNRSWNRSPIETPKPPQPIIEWPDF